MTEEDFREEVSQRQESCGRTYQKTCRRYFQGHNPEEHPPKFALQKEMVFPEKQKAQWHALMRLFSLTLIYDVILQMATDTGSDEVLLSIQRVPSDDILERLHKMRTRGSDQHKTVLASYEQSTEQQSTTELPEIEGHGEEIYASEDQSPKF